MVKHGFDGFLIALISLLSCAGAASGTVEPAPPAVPIGTPGPGCAWPVPVEIRAADVAIAIDRSRSTREPTGLDLDGDGVVGEFRRSVYTDRDDSLLAAEIAAIGRLVDVARLGDMRFAVISYSGRDRFPLEDSVTQWVDREDARLEAELTGDVAELDAALARIARRGSNGASSFAPAMRLALQSLRSDASDPPTRRRLVLFLSDSPTPVRYAPEQRIARDDPRMEIQARRAIATGVSFHSFAIGPAAADDPPHILASIAGATGGLFRAVPDPRNLYCEILGALRVDEPR